MKLLINIDVADLATAEAFYTAAFGLHAGPPLRRRRGGTARRRRRRSICCRSPPAPSAPTHSPRDYARHWTPMHCDVVVDDLDAALARAIAAGAMQEGAIREAEWGRIVQLADPFGHGWCLLQFRGRGYDEIAT